MKFIMIVKQTLLRESDKIVCTICNKIPFIKLTFIDGPLVKLRNF